MRRFLTRLRHGLLLTALLCILLARVAVPAGWMPAAGAHGMTLAPCSGMGVATLALHAMPGMAMPGHGEPQRHPDPGGDHPCAGAGLSVALDQPIVALPRTPPVRAAAIVSVRRVATIGQGLAAPPPPPTGPPRLV